MLRRLETRTEPESAPKLWTSVSDPSSLNPDPDPAKNLNPDPDPEGP